MMRTTSFARGAIVAVFSMIMLSLPARGAASLRVEVSTTGQTVALGAQEAVFTVAVDRIYDDVSGAVNSVPLRSITTLISVDSRTTLSDRTDGSPDCLAFVPNASFTFVPFGCSGASCEGMQAEIEVPIGATLPVTLYSCSVRLPVGVGGSYRIRADVADAITGTGEHILGDPSITALHVRDGAPVALSVPPTIIEAGDGGQIEVHLQTHGFAIAGVQMDLRLGGTLVFGVSDNGRPRCRVNPEILKEGTATSFQPPGSSTFDRARAIVLSLSNVFPIADGLLMTCDIFELNNASGTYRLDFENIGFSDPAGNAVSGVAGFGTITVVDGSSPPSLRVEVSTTGQTVALGAQEAVFTVAVDRIYDDVSGAVNSVPLRSITTLISVDSRTTLSDRTDGSPDCLAFVPNASFTFVPFGCSGASCEGMQAQIEVPVGSTLPVTLYSCSVRLPAGVGGSYRIRADVADAITGTGEHILGDPSITALHVRDGAPVALSVPPTIIEAGRGGQIEVHVQTHGFAIAGMQMDLRLGGTLVFGVSDNGRPRCRVNPEILKEGTATSFQPPGSSTFDRARALVLSLSNVFPIADGMLITCDIFEFNNTSATYRLDLENIGFSDPAGNAISGVAGFGTITVVDGSSPTPTRTAMPTATMTHTAAPSATHSLSPTHTHTPVPTVVCAGDCGNDGEVTIDELVKLVNIALGMADLSICRSADVGGDGQVTIDELVRGVNSASIGCGTAGIRDSHGSGDSEQVAFPAIMGVPNLSLRNAHRRGERDTPGRERGEQPSPAAGDRVLG